MKHSYKKYLLPLLLMGSLAPAHAQHTLVGGDDVLEISGRVSTFYNLRFLKAGEEDKKNNRFKVRDLIIGLDGRHKNTWEYELKVDLADLASNAGASSAFDPENPGLMSAYVAYKGLPFEIKMGYDKLPYSMFMLTSLDHTLYWQRPQMLRGEFFSMRDAGITLSQDLWQKKIKLYAGIYTGMGEQIVALDESDASARPEYVGRVEFAYPAPYKMREIDMTHVPKPMFRIGANARYTNKTQPNGESISSDLTGDFGIKMVDGKRLAYGLDASFQYQGFSLQAEYQRMDMKPQNTSDALYNNTTEAQNGGVIHAGGCVVQANYHVKPIRTAISMRYEYYNPNDLEVGHAERLSAAAGYYFPGSGAAVKVHYYHILKEDQNSEPVKWTDQLRFGVYYNF
ncbi:MAG: porin [Edaphocola sp.]